MFFCVYFRRYSTEGTLSFRYEIYISHNIPHLATYWCKWEGRVQTNLFSVDRD